VRHITTNTSAAADAQLAIRKVVILLGDRHESGGLKNVNDALERVAALLDGICNELDGLTIALYTAPRLEGALRAAYHALSHAAIVASTEARVRDNQDSQHFNRQAYGPGPDVPS